MATKNRTGREPTAARRKADKLRLDRVERHVFLCCDDDERGCASAKQMARAWEHLRARLKSAGLDRRVARSRTRCLGLCEDGPIAVVWPEGAWYGPCDAAVLDRIVDEHLTCGRIVEDHLIAIARPPRDDER